MKPEENISEELVETMVASLHNRGDFVKFLRLLCHDLAANTQSWENRTLEDFLEALSRYAEEIDGYYQNMHIPVNPEQPSWRLFADMLVGAKGYE